MEPINIQSEMVGNYWDARLHLNFEKQTVMLDGEPVHLTPLEFGLLAQLARNAGTIVSRDTLMLKVWGYGPEIRTRTMDVHLRRLRMKLGSYSRQHLETIFSLGYRLQPCYVTVPLTAGAGAHMQLAAALPMAV